MFNLKGQRFLRLELRISGTVEGWSVKQGPRTEYFNDAPDFVFAQSGNNGPRFKGIGRYTAASGHGNIVILRCPSAWKKDLPVWGAPRSDVWLMRAVKQQLDPHGLFNPGRFVDGI